MSQPSPEWIEPLGLVRQQARLAGEVAPTAMPRLAALLRETGGTLAWDLEAGTDAQGVKYLRGGVRGSLTLTCQRCLEALAWAVDIRYHLGVVADEAAGERLPEPYEPLLAGTGPMRLAALLEDEILLALPAIPRHPAGTCGAPAGAEPVPEAPARENPFAVLAALKRDGKDDED